MMCIKCGDEYNINERKGKPGKLTECNSCAEETVIKYTGNMIYSDKTAAQLQINTNPMLTQYILNATKLQCKGSNLGNNLKVAGDLAKTVNACLKSLNNDVAKRRI